MLPKIKSVFRKFLPVEAVLLIYLVITAIIILIFWGNIVEPLAHLLLRIAIVVFYVTLVNYTRINKHRIFRIFLPFIFLPFLYGETDFFNNIILQDLDPVFSSLEYKLFGAQPSMLFSETIPNRLFAELMYFGYFSYYFMVFGLVLYSYYSAGKESCERVGFIVIASFLMFYLFFDFFPVAGPQFYFIDQLKPLPDGYIFGPAIRLVQDLGEKPTAAFPSSHVAMCLILIWMAYKISKKIFALLIVIGFLLIFSTVYIRAHYVIDVIAGLISAPFIYFVAEQMFKKLSLPDREKS